MTPPPPYLYDPQLAPLEHRQELIQRVRCPPLPGGAYVQRHVWQNGRFRTAPDAGLASTSVLPPEINPPAASRQSAWGGILTSDDPAVTFRHSGWARARQRIRAAFVSLNVSARKLSAFDLCGSDPWVAVDESDSTRFKILTNHCHSRWCVPCSRQRAARICGNLRTKFNDGSLRFLTFTMKHSDTPLPQQIDRIYASFRTLRRLPLWQAHVDGGAAVLEIKHSHRDHLWHVHIHMLAQGRYIRHADLKREWHRITGDSFVVDVRPVNSADDAARYITKYITKPVASTIVNKPAPLAELIGACARRRLVLTWGTWRGLKLSAPLDDTVWKSICPLRVVFDGPHAPTSDNYRLLVELLRCCPEAPLLVNKSPPPLTSENTHGLLP